MERKNKCVLRGEDCRDKSGGITFERENERWLVVRTEPYFRQSIVRKTGSIKATEDLLERIKPTKKLGTVKSIIRGPSGIIPSGKEKEKARQRDADFGKRMGNIGWQ